MRERERDVIRTPSGQGDTRARGGGGGGGEKRGGGVTEERNTLSSEDYTESYLVTAKGINSRINPSCLSCGLCGR